MPVNSNGVGGHLRSEQVWLSEHYWPDLAPELVLGQAQRLAQAGGSLSALALPGHHSVMGLWVAGDEADVRATLARGGLAAGAVSQGWLITRSVRDAGVGRPAS